ncbi:MAG: amino acid permease [Candidatus Binatia bacterium]
MKPSDKGVGARQLTWTLAWAVVFCDIGTSVYYVPGILYGMVGNLAPFFVILTAIGFVLISIKYIEIVARTPGGGGVVAVGDMAFGERIGALGGMFITVDFFLTCEISSVSGFYYLSSVIPSIEANVPAYACVGLMMLAAVNIVGVRESARLSLVMAMAAFVTNMAVLFFMVAKLSPADWVELFSLFDGVGQLSFRELLVGFGAAWLAFSGLESISQLAPAMRQPIKRTAAFAMIGVIITILLTSPMLTLLSVAKVGANGQAANSERFISELAGQTGVAFLSTAVVFTAASLLLFAANTAIIGAYHVFLKLAELHYVPRRLMKRNTRFNTPHVAIIFATAVPLAVIMLSEGEMSTLGDMYAFGLLGAFIIESGGLDRLRWRDGQRGLSFWVGLAPTAMVVVAWLVNIVEKPSATLFGGGIAASGMMYGIALREGWIKEAIHQIPAVSRSELARASRGEAHAPEIIKEIVNLQMAQQIKPLYNSSTLVAVKGSNAHVVAEAIRRVKGMGETAVYCLYVEEWPGLFYGKEDLLPSDEGVRALAMAVRQASSAGVELIPIWTSSFSVAEGMSRAARELGVSSLVIGVSRRSLTYRVFRGAVVKKLSRMLPSRCRLLICD